MQDRTELQKGSKNEEHQELYWYMSISEQNQWFPFNNPVFLDVSHCVELDLWFPKQQTLSFTEADADETES